MVMLPIHSCRKKAGFTLIEVLIALAIISIAMTAIIKSTSQNIRATTYLQNKTMALWVGEEILNEARIGLLALPVDEEGREGKTVLLKRDWQWHATKEVTPNKAITKITVNVFAKGEGEVSPLISLESYVYHVKE